MRAAAFPCALSLCLAFAPASAEPTRHMVATPTRRFDVQHRDLHVRFDFVRRSIEGRMTLSFQALDTLSSVTLDQRELAIGAVRDSAAGALAFETADDRLVVRLARRLDRGDRAAIVVDYRATPRAGLYWTGPDADHPGRRAEVWSQGETENARFWFPDVDEPVERAASDLWYTVPAPMRAFGNGHLVETLAEPGGREMTFHWRLSFPHPSYLVTVAAGTFAVVDTVWRGIPVEYIVPPGTERHVARSMGRTPEMMEFFSQRLGVDYPYERYAQVVVQDFSFGGMENITATTMTERILLDPVAALERTQEGLVAHELAHQWFGDYTTCREWAHAWLNEGFANFCADLWWEHAWGRDELDRSLLEQRDGIFANESAKGRRPVIEPNRRSAQELFDAGIYARGAWTLHMLRRRLGDEAMFRGLRHYLEQVGGRSVDTDEFRHAMEDATGAGLDEFFEQWVERAGFPDLKVTWEWLDERGLAHVVVEQTQPSDSLTPVFRFDLPVRFALAGGETRSVMHIDGRRHEIYVPLAARPRYVEVNDDLSVLCRVSFDRPVGELAAQLAGAPLAASRMEAARALGEMAGRPKALEALRRALAEDRFYAVRRAAARALGAAPTETGLGALEAGLRDRDARVRKVAVAALASFRDVPGAVSAARRALVDPAYGVAAAGAGSLARLGAPEAYDACVDLLGKPSWNDTLRTAGLEGLAELGEARAVPIMIARTRRREPIPVRIAAARALGRLGARLPPEPAAGRTTRREVRLALEPLLWDDHLRLRQEAASALGTLGDPDGLPALARLLEREPEDGVLATVLDARTKLQRGDRSARELEAEVEKLKDKNRAIEGRIKALEEALKQK